MSTPNGKVRITIYSDGTLTSIGVSQGTGPFVTFDSVSSNAYFLGGPLKVGQAYIVPIILTAYSVADIAEGNTCTADFRLVIVPASGNPTVVPSDDWEDEQDAAVQPGCLYDFYIGQPSPATLDLKVASENQPSIYEWLYDSNGPLQLPVRLPTPDPGFQRLPAGDDDLVTSITTRQGLLSIVQVTSSTTSQGVGTVSDKITLRGSDIELPNIAPSDTAAPFEGFIPKVFQVGDRDIVIAKEYGFEIVTNALIPEMVQIISIGPSDVEFSNRFGTGYDDIYYQSRADSLAFSVAGYAAACGQAAHCNTKVQPEPPSFAFANFLYEKGQVTIAGKYGILQPPADTGTKPAPAQASGWIVLDGPTSSCMDAADSSVGAQGGTSPATLDTLLHQLGITDKITVNRDAGGNITSVVMEVLPGGSVAPGTFLYFKSMDLCSAFLEAAEAPPVEPDYLK